jgi:hypothetical protein
MSIKPVAQLGREQHSKRLTERIVETKRPAMTAAKFTKNTRNTTEVPGQSLNEFYPGITASTRNYRLAHIARSAGFTEVSAFRSRPLLNALTMH